jgi:predicted metal-binding protein
MTKSSAAVTIRPRRGPPILVCKKCLKRVGEGRDFKRALKSEVKRRGRAQDIKRPRIVMTSCFDICPKHAVVLASGATLHRGDYLLADQKSVVDAVAVLMPPDDAAD